MKIGTREEENCHARLEARRGGRTSFSLISPHVTFLSGGDFYARSRISFAIIALRDMRLTTRSMHSSSGLHVIHDPRGRSHKPPAPPMLMPHLQLLSTIPFENDCWT